MRVGIIGCGNISDIYATNSKLFRDLDIVACADVVPEAAARVAAKFNLRPLSVAELLAAEDIDIVLNLTIPSAHAEVCLAALEAGKHVFVEKPLATTIEDAQAILELAAKRNLRVGCAPDTILGAGLQVSRRLIDQGVVGQILTGTASIMSRGMEHWHPNPAFFYKAGGGPVLDIGPYHVSALCALLGPVESVRATGQISPVDRLYGAEGPNKGKTFKAETFTSLNAIISFVGGAQINLIASWDVWRHGTRPIELYGTLASIRVPDPDTFGGDVELSDNSLPVNPHDAAALAAHTPKPDWELIDTTTDAFGGINYPFGHPAIANYRSLGLAEMANAIVEKRQHRCSGDFAVHVLSVMLGILQSATTGKPVDIGHRVERPAALTADDGARLLRHDVSDVGISAT